MNFTIYQRLTNDNYNSRLRSIILVVLILIYFLINLVWTPRERPIIGTSREYQLTGESTIGM